MKKLTLKQLYGYSIMNWEQCQNRLERSIMERECSFCRDSNWRCNNCRVNKKICNNNEDYSIYNKISTAENNLEDEISDIIWALREEYYKVK